MIQFFKQIIIMCFLKAILHSKTENRRKLRNKSFAFEISITRIELCIPASNGNFIRVIKINKKQKIHFTLILILINNIILMSH